MRIDKRKFNEMREMKIDTSFMQTVDHSVLISVGNTRVLCSATLERGVPRWLKGKGEGWVTAEYGMLPKCSSERIRRERKSVAGRTQEIQRLIGRSLRAGIDLVLLGEKQIIIDCDVIQADGGTRTAGVTGGFVAMSLLINDLLNKKELRKNPITSNIFAISAGFLGKDAYLDLNYHEDSRADVDLNIVMNSDKNIVEIQGTGEERVFSQEELIKLIALAKDVSDAIISKQNDAIQY